MEKFNLKRKNPVIIAGPCSAETEEQTVETCMQLAQTGMVDVFRAGVWKPRTRPGMFEGVGLKGLGWVAKAKELTGLPTAIEVATAKHVEAALEFGVDILWIGARTTVNPFSVQEISDAVRGSNVTILVKNPVGPDIELWAGAVQRLQKVGIDRIGLIHRGFSAIGGEYRNSPMWHLAIEMRRRMPEIPMIGDPSHIVGRRDGLLEMSQKIADLDYDGLIVESHIRPDEAWSDAAQQLTPAALAEMLKRVTWRTEVVNLPEFERALAALRGQIDQIDNELFELLAKRMRVAEKIGEVKRDNNVTILQRSRWGDIVERIKAQAVRLDLSPEFLTTILEAIHIESIDKQNKVMNLSKD
ncbi:MAG: bifunctional 3-deoxy-7-phosphoheptulonate synthase/chorismate mutase type II [Rikenellaceae bacterium]|jgi:chorismate mutase|nr:bifunctional 3-deoxy-7-phosphoheptulonate synthase/chorismate mutase type II [Rikenellaceae bacterium]